ncbi:MAG: hypothetical protein QW651_07225 [Candidatus Nezhaarchaeales archaeon]
MNKRNVLLCALLKCGPLGLKVIEGTEVDWFKVVERMDKDEPVNFNTLIHAAETVVLEEELGGVEGFSLKDFECYHNYLDTTVALKPEAKGKYPKEKLKRVWERLGVCFTY